MALIHLLVVGAFAIGVVHSQPCGGPCPGATPCCDPQDDTTCVECCMDSECTTGNDTVCDVLNHMCVECLDDEDCDFDAGKPICDTGTNLCMAECNVAGDCATPNETCVAGVCVCSTDMDPCNGPNEMCDADGNCTCTGGRVRETGGDCIQDCDCPADQICTRILTCVCPSGTVQQTNGTCSACERECSTSANCRNEGEICNTATGRCECPTGRKLFRGRCVESGKLGGFCSSGRCWGRRVACNRTTNMCMCRGGCDAGTVCLRRRSSRPWGQTKGW